MNIVVLISANAEWHAVKEIYPHLNVQNSPYGEFAELIIDERKLVLFQGGWGKISAAASTQYVVDHFDVDLIINLGTCGGFEGRIETGTIMLVERTLVYDIIEQMGDPAKANEFYATDIDLAWLDGAQFPQNVLRGLLISADRDIVRQEIPMLIERYNAVAADWESGAIAWAAQKNHKRVLILRAVSDLVSADGGEAYGDLELFQQRTMAVMKDLFVVLRGLLNN